MNCESIIKSLEKENPLSYAESWDNTGLQIGSRENDVETIYIALDPTKEVIEDAIMKGADMLITHHPLIFSPMKKITSDHFIGERVIQLIQHHISYYVMHTNYDICNMAELSGDILKLKNHTVLDTTSREKLYKVAVYVPEGQKDAVFEAMTGAGAGHVGAYSHCTFQTKGTGTFYPLAGTHPFIGEEHVLSKVSEHKIETVVPEGILDCVIKAMLSSHPYEEPAYDIYELIQTGSEKGVGRIGSLPDVMSLADCALYVKKQFSIPNVKVFGSLDTKVERAAISPGSGKDYIQPALNGAADVLITGDIGHHDGIDAIARGLAIIDAGHYGLEHIFTRDVKNMLEQNTSGVTILMAPIAHPFQVI